jgi:hypothetical protein
MLWREDAAPGDLQGRPVILSGRRLNYELADHADVLVRPAGVKSGRERDRIDVNSMNVTGGCVRLE